MPEVNTKQEAWIPSELDQLASAQLLRRTRPRPEAKGQINLSGNDYLGLTRHPHVLESARKALDTYGAGAGASRLVTGTLTIHEELEARLAKHKGYEDALLFGSGFMTNAGLVTSMVRKGDRVFADRLIHASLIDAIRLSRATLHRFPHNDAEALGNLLERYPADRRLIVTESVFSMNGDRAPLKAIADLATRHAAMLLVDEAHATGVWGPHGAGCVAAEALQPAVTLCMGTLSKALGGYGGYVACSSLIKEWLLNRARSFIYTTAPPPAVAGAALGALDVLASDPSMGLRLLERATGFRNTLRSAGLDTMQSDSQIIPILIGDSGAALRISDHLFNQGIHLIAIRRPTVPLNMARLRISISLTHSDADLDRAATALIHTAQQENLVK